MKVAALIAVVLCAFAFTSESAMARGGQHPINAPECEAAKKACEGFKPGDHKKNGHGFWMDCVGKVAEGQTVEGVTLSQDDAKKCVAVGKAAHDAKKAH